ncbi:MAG: hypothetical protein K0Q56_584 [Sporolactobacillus laevolacticus]|nr:hypothetical protein [Sporolactobacillus laevolacticus]
MTLTIEHLTKRFQSFTAVNDLQFTAEKGEIFGLIGQMVPARQQRFG